MEDHSLSDIFAALADPTRLSIIARLAEGEATVNELAAPFAISQPAISRHLKVLEDAGLILRRVHGVRRPCRLAHDALSPLEAWLSQMRRVFTTHHDHLDTLLSAMRAHQRKNPP